MLTCWDEQPCNRPTFTTLRSKFDTMLLADKNEEYIDLHIDNNRSYYQEFFQVEKNGSACGGSDISVSVTEKPRAQTSKKESMKQKRTEDTGDRLMYKSLHGASSAEQVNTKKGQHYEQGRLLATSIENRDSDNRAYVNTGRPVSMYLSTDRNERGNPYVDEPSSMVASALTLPNTSRLGAATDWSSEGAIELRNFDSSDQPKQKCPEIQVSFAGDCD